MQNPLLIDQLDDSSEKKTANKTQVNEHDYESMQIEEEKYESNSPENYQPELDEETMSKISSIQEKVK